MAVATATWSVGHLVWCLLFVAIAAVGTWLARGYALRRRLVDEPGERRSHHIPTPRGGGIAIVNAVMIAMIAILLRYPIDWVPLAGGVTGLVLVALAGWIDDHRHVSPWLRLLVHGVAGLSLATGIVLGGAPLGLGLWLFLTTVVLVNVWNFMDGIDSLAATQALIVAIALLSLSTDNVLVVHLGLAFIAAILGFLPFNWPRAKIFLGDVGSGALGYVLAMLAGLVAMGASTGQVPRLSGIQAWLLMALPFSAFLLDAGLTLLFRVVRGERWWTAHVEHVYQRWGRRVGSHGRVSAAYALWTGLAGWLMWGLRGTDTRGLVMATGIWIGMGIALWYWLRRRSAGVLAVGTELPE